MTSDPLGGFTQEWTPETKTFVDLAKQVLAQRPKVTGLTVDQVREQARQQAELTRVEVPQAQARSIPGPAGAIPLSVIEPPAQPDGIYLHIHGGGWIGGEHTSLDARHLQLSGDASVVTIDVGYRLAPEHRYPAAPDDCEAAALWCVEQATGDYGCDSVVIGGESAGAHLAAVTLLRMRDRHSFTGFRGAELRYGCYDLRTSPSVRHAHDDFLGPDPMRWILGHFVDEALRDDPDVSPLLASLHDMPPALFTIGTLDSLVDDTLFMWARWRAAGNDAELRVYPGGMHAFDMAPFPLGQQAVAEITRFVSERVKTPAQLSSRA